MPKNNPMQRTVSIVPAIYIQVAGGLNPALTKNSSVAGTVILPMMCGIKNTAQMMRRMLNSLSRLNLSASDMAVVPPAVFGPPPTFKNRTSWRVRQPLAPLSTVSRLLPSVTPRIKRRKRRSIEPRKLVLDLVPDLALQVGEVAVAFGELRQMRLVEREPRVRLDRIDAIFLVGEPPQYDTPTALALFQEIVKAAGADNVAQHALDLCAL